MPITLNNDSINFGNYSISLHPNGIEIDGKFKYASNAIPAGPVGVVQGTVSGYTSGGQGSNVIDKFPFASNANATDVGDLTLSRAGPTGQSSTESGYSSGDRNPKTTIDKFPFAAGGNATDVGDLTVGTYYAAGQSSTESGYTSAGYPLFNVIQKFPFAADANATDAGDLTQNRDGTTGQSSSVSGYTSGGGASPTTVNTIDKFPFAADANATDVGDLTQARRYVSGQSSTISGYTSGGSPGTSAPATINIIDKFSFASNANATDVGDLTRASGLGPTGQSSTESGYTSGGYVSPAGQITNIIDKFPFVSNANATDVGDLTLARYFPAGQQV